MIKFAIKVTTETDTVLQSQIQEAPNEEVFKAFTDGVYKSIGTGNFLLEDADGDPIIIPQHVISRSIIQIIKVP